MIGMQPTSPARCLTDQEVERAAETTTASKTTMANAVAATTVKTTGGVGIWYGGGGGGQWRRRKKVFKKKKKARKICCRFVSQKTWIKESLGAPPLPLLGLYQLLFLHLLQPIPNIKKEYPISTRQIPFVSLTDRLTGGIFLSEGCLLEAEDPKNLPEAPGVITLIRNFGSKVKVWDFLATTKDSYPNIKMAQFESPELNKL